MKPPNEPMTILEPGAEWPQVWAINPGTGLREPTDTTLLAIVGDAYHKWMHDHAEPPTKLLVGHAKRRKFLDMFAAAYTGPTKPYTGPMTFMGLEVQWQMDDGMRIA